jgi:succinoglycan biosynthesis transport protein ExoP
VGLVVLFGLLSGTYRFVHQTETDMGRHVPLLGILPKLSEVGNGEALSEDAAHSVHRLRVLLESAPHPKPAHNVYMVTSACGGEGKTSLTLALGLSFAASGCKTLVVDSDLMGQGITRGFGASGEPGLREAMARATARGLVKKTPQGLRLLTAGRVDRFSGWTLPTAGASGIIAELRQFYEVVLIDTGPLLGSVEASVIAPEVDGVILTIARGQQRSLVERAIRHLASLRIKPVGFVFNRARSADFKRSAFSSSGRETSGAAGDAGDVADRRDPRRDPVMSGLLEDLEGFGPLVRSVATCLRNSADAST